MSRFFVRHIGEVAPVLAVALVFDLYLLWVVDPEIVYFRHRPAWYLEYAWFQRTVGSVGGLADYLAAFLVQFYRYPPVGALLMTTMAAAVCLMAGVVFRQLSGRWQPVLMFMVGACLLVLNQDYDHRPTWDLSLLTALAGAGAYLSATRRAAGWGPPAFVALSALLYLAAGPLSLLATALSAIGDFGRRRLPSGAFGVLVGAAMPWAVGRLFSLGPAEAYTEGLVTDWQSPLRWFEFGLLALLVMAAAGLAARHRLRMILARVAHRKTAARISSWAARRRALPWGGLIPGAGVLGLATVAALVAYARFDRERYWLLKTEVLCQRHLWPEALEAAERLPQQYYYPDAAENITRALFHTGRLPDDLFLYVQNAARPSVLGAWAADRPTLQECIQLACVLLELGRVNEAEHMACEALEKGRERPDMQRLLADIKLLKGQKQAALVYLNRLEKTISDRHWARRRRQALDVGLDLAGDPELKRIRSVMVRRDTAGRPGVRFMLEDLLESCPRNRMAFEYLVAYLLLTRDPAFIRILDRFGGFDAQSPMPRSYDEALTIAANDPALSRNAESRHARPATMEQFHRFQRIASEHAGHPSEALPELSREFGDTYFFYFYYGFSPRGGT